MKIQKIKKYDIFINENNQIQEEKNNETVEKDISDKTFVDNQPLPWKEEDEQQVETEVAQEEEDEIEVQEEEEIQIEEKHNSNKDYLKSEETIIDFKNFIKK